ncbi:MAG: hypothetical protein Q4G43_00370 [Mobilicoccus sp.]|nr:hypothetical protein [Mobilicoccus sp.]
MMTATAHPRVAAYLDALHRAASALPHGQRQELLADITEHLEVALDGVELAGPEWEIAVRTTLDRLGSPEDLVRAAGGAPGSGVAGQPERASRWSGHGVTGIVLFVVGLVLFLGDQVWTSGEKTLGAFVLGGGALIVGPIVAFVGLVSFLMPTQECTDDGTTEVCTSGALAAPASELLFGLGLLGAVILPVIVVATLLITRARRRRRATL